MSRITSKHCAFLRRASAKVLLCAFALGSACASPLCAQGTKECATILEKALPGAGESDDFSLTFEGIAFGLDKPTSIFTQPVYEVFRGGYMHMKGDRYEINLGRMKAMSDGKLMVIVDEASQTLYLDSLHHAITDLQMQSAPGIASTLEQAFGDAAISCQGSETVNGKTCLRIRTETTGADYSSHSIFWVEQATGRLLLMADWNGQAYDTYWIKSVGITPKGHDFSINVPRQEIQELHGYKAVDMRFAAQELYNQH